MSHHFNTIKYHNALAIISAYEFNDYKAILQSVNYKETRKSCHTVL